MSYRKKPIVIEAFQMTKARSLDNSDWPVWLHQAWARASNEMGAMALVEDAPRQFFIQTLEGRHFVTWDDWIIQGIDGELYPCKPHIFELTYDAC